ncbi:hypothetical protein [Streptomyces xiaopingdaonensis]|uniref:hypothetical protein n=1 Tax=Streptomyces xiaopingdaonensis TaxID=1565415 RepID=UPI0002DFB45E|nr:hypothetical protein [Streptomyces xiaopingdaonensis]
MSSYSDFRQRLAAADARIALGNHERAAGADERARVIDSEATRRGKTGTAELAEVLGVSVGAIRAIRARARRGPDSARTLPSETLELLLAAEAATLPPLARAQWTALARLIRRTLIDVSWIERPGLLLADEVEAELGEEFDPAALARACRAWRRTQALAVIDACQRDNLDALPTSE